MSRNTFWDAALRYASGVNAADVFAQQPSAADCAFPTEEELTTVLDQKQDLNEEDMRRMVHLTYALAATLPGTAKLVFPTVAADSRLRQLYPDRPALEPLLQILDHLEALRQSCDALPGGSFELVSTEGELLHFTRTGPTEILDAIFNCGPHLKLAIIDGKSTQVNPYGFTLTVREHGHNANHSYYDWI